jgi:hypothetical protein
MSLDDDGEDAACKDANNSRNELETDVEVSKGLSEVTTPQGVLHTRSVSLLDSVVSSGDVLVMSDSKGRPWVTTPPTRKSKRGFDVVQPREMEPYSESAHKHGVCGEGEFTRNEYFRVVPRSVASGLETPTPKSSANPDIKDSPEVTLSIAHMVPLCAVACPNLLIAV